jgi:hypothetical protein
MVSKSLSILRILGSEEILIKLGKLFLNNVQIRNQLVVNKQLINSLLSLLLFNNIEEKFTTSVPKL